MAIGDALRGYTGRGVVLRSEPDAVGWAYFVTGRSVASRQRRVSLRGDCAFIEPVGPPTLA